MEGQLEHRERALGALVGLAVGDAVGTTLEFCQRDRQPAIHDMVGGGPFGLKPGQWTDDTSMALALADSLLECGKLDPRDLMERFDRWRKEGAYSSTGRCFDIGITTRQAIDRWRETDDPIAGSTDPDTAGNGSLMRLAPVAVRYWNDRESLRGAAALQSRTTHGADAAVDACLVYAEMTADAIEGLSFEAIVDRAARAADDIGNEDIARIVRGSWREKQRDEICSSGYVVHSLEAALWSIEQGGNFRETILIAANLAGDADTTAAIAGQLAGAIYGINGIPEDWRRKIAYGEWIMDLGNRLFDASLVS